MRTVVDLWSTISEVIFQDCSATAIIACRGRLIAIAIIGPSMAIAIIATAFAIVNYE